MFILVSTKKSTILSTKNQQFSIDKSTVLNYNKLRADIQGCSQAVKAPDFDSGISLVQFQPSLPEKTSQ